MASTLEQQVMALAWVFALLVARLMPLLMLAPLTGGLAIPVRMRCGFACVVALMLTPAGFAASAPMPEDALRMGLAFCGELILGLLLGSIMLLAITSLQISGQLLGQLAGFEMAAGSNLGGVSAGDQTGASVLVHLMTWIALLALLAAGGHRYFLQCALQSMNSYPVGAVQFEGGWLRELEYALNHTWSVGVRAAMPLAFVLFVLNLAFGMLGRAIPQFNVISIGLNANALVLMAMLLFAIGGASWVYQMELAGWLEACQRIVVADQ